MTIGFVTTAVFLDRTPRRRRPSASSSSSRARAAPPRGPRDSLTAVFYNFSLFALLAYTRWRWASAPRARLVFSAGA